MGILCPPLGGGIIGMARPGDRVSQQQQQQHNEDKDRHPGENGVGERFLIGLHFEVGDAGVV